MVFITLTNTGYIDYTLNCLKSLKIINCDIDLHCYCIGKKGYKILKKLGYICYLINDEDNSNFQRFRKGNWSNIVQQKFDIIHSNLLKHEYVCFTDGDIVYENRNFYKYLVDNIGDNDMIVQNDRLDNNIKNDICSGFMFIRSNTKTIALFDPVNTNKFKNKPKWGDQDYVNEIKKELKYNTLPLELFPNGKYYYNNSSIKPYLIHFNWTKGHTKKKKMISYKKWYI
jgi:hypothetical protein